MLKARQGKEIVIKVRNEIGVVNQVATILADKGINILALSAWVQGEDGVMRMVTDDNLRAGDTLREKNYNPTEGGVVLTETPHRPGMLKHLTERLAGEGIDIHHLYATATDKESTCLVVLSCANNDRAFVLLNE